MTAIQSNPGYSLLGLIPTPPQSLQSNALSSERPEEDFIKLMVAQLQNQDPDNPADGTQLISQLAQMNAAIATQRMSYLSTENHAVSTAAALLGKEVTLTDPLTKQSVSGKVQTVDYSKDRPQIVVDGAAYPLDAVVRVDEAEG